ncbi:Peroxisome biogenesis protein 22 [Babesia sp. Xinjiang]|uniref:Peroxisome biogenesis protein 22 n=1 Tax=Babesia sp. Xinjiang TaxID=462227 RepID=UPI000A244146|nr:Peroxisome biogenesis protein 22 [Babesia sp. Xinjiang]ORM40136.1 Peroxisome biogenesis protein 22 [Babesia sp. Xinjiang]
MKPVNATGVPADKSAVIAALLAGVVTLVISFWALHVRSRRNARTTVSDEGENNSDDGTPSVSIFVNDLIFQKGLDKPVVDNVLPLAELANKCNLYLFVQVTDESDIAVVLQGLEKAESFTGELKKHRVLFSGTSAGRASMVRQLQPQLHLETDPTVFQTVSGKVPNVLQFAVVKEESTSQQEDEQVENDDVIKVRSAASIIEIIEPYIEVA